MPTFEDILEEPWNISQRKTGNCGFAAVLMHLVAIRSPMVSKLISFVKHDPQITLSSKMKDRETKALETKSIDAKMQSSIQKREFFHFPHDSQYVHAMMDSSADVEDCDWYLIVALSLYFVNNVDKRILAECKDLSKSLAPNWEHGPKLKDAISRIKSYPTEEEQIHHFKKSRETFVNTYKAGHLGLTQNGMIELLKLCHIPIFDGNWRECIWTDDQKNNCYNLVHNPELNLRQRAILQISLLPQWQQFVLALESLPANVSAFVAVKALAYENTDTPEETRLADYTFKNFLFNHWVYCRRDEKSNAFYLWSNGLRFRMNRTKLIGEYNATTGHNSIILPMIFILVRQ